ncbi:transporter substrate-binding domain-containing protein [Pseudomonas sp. 10S4]|uniref:transporter substrate-binding domain-containing protein n=1 Tax=Pseudomonas sp. 10S4 TaxID=3048583 RepID=UPI002AC8CFCA|nr:MULTISPECIES: transporter substrate-binding domain-containing protein [unclassified Pseudomonas]MEB0225722.1 transporter substrate-binding domain-containing protein [Pseudomonas sp. 5S1]MEB0296916.1 transporter substrate-binding domain-containing protein [Pseudomonas sp. 10S4]WPX20916.1 transporter substrate-binding domain-containing protein [Pseudomonas sp. 10S4]
MRFLRGFRPAMCWIFLLGTLGFGPCGLAAQLATYESRESVVGTAIGLDALERQWVREHPKVIVASMQYPLYLFKDEHGHWVGLNNDVLNQISAMTGLLFIHEESFSTDQLLGRLESGEADMSTTLAMNDPRKVFLDFSHAFGGSGWALVGRSGAPLLQSLEQLSERILVLPARHALEETIRRDYSDIQLRTVKTYAEARALVESGEAYATIENETGAQLYPLGLLKVGHTVEGMWEADHLSVRKGQPELLSILNKALEAFPPAELRAIRLKWLEGIAPKPALPLWRRVTQWGCWGMFIVSMFGVLSLFWNRRLAALIKQRLDAEKDLSDQLAFQHALIDAMPDPMFVRDLEGRLIMCNKSYEEGLSTRFDQVQGRQLIEVDVMPKETAEMLHAEFISQLNTRKTRFSHRQLRFNNGVRDIYQWTVPFYSADGQLRGLLGGWTDIGQRRGSGQCRCSSRI